MKNTSDSPRRNRKLFNLINIQKPWSKSESFDRSIHRAEFRSGKINSALIKWNRCGRQDGWKKARWSGEIKQTSLENSSTG